jgi:hypothetical protein
MRSKLVDRIPDHTELTEADLNRRHIEHRLSSRARLDINTDDIARMVAEFAASRGIHQMQARLRGSFPPLSGVIAMRTYVTTIGMIVGLLAVWVVLMPFVA